MNSPTTENPDRDAEVFAQVVALPPERRAAYLAQACGNDTAMRHRIEVLVEAQAQVGGFLEQTGDDSEIGKLVTAAHDGASGRVGRYRLIGKIGEGGCGVVYLAEQDEPITRQVALKIIKPGMDTKEVIARFEAERQALALMDHPGIAKVFDAGQTDSGRPFFVMELIRGMKITDYCDQHALSTEERLKLFVQVCHAIQHAHQKGIIHRDIKPSNILVTTNAEGARQPVVIDFGIAKATVGVHLTDKTLFTAVDMLIGTPTYMSPEQTTASRTDVDTRSDIYSLGVLLYELLTGTTPFDAGELLQLGIDEVRRAIREREPLRPSARLSKMTGESLTSVAQRRRSEPPTLIRAVRGDLDWIAMKALEKDRARRYETANGLAADVGRFLANEVVSARPASLGYRLQKTVQRHKLLFTVAGAVALLLLVSLALIATSLAMEKRARQEADQARRQAEANLARAVKESAKSQQVTRFLEELLQGAGPLVALGRDTTILREILDKAVGRIDTELVDQPAVAADLKVRIGGVYSQLAAYAQAEDLHRAALAAYRKLLGRDAPEVATALNNLGVVLIRQGKIPAAEEALTEALAVQRKLYGREHLDIATTLSRLASALNNDGRTGEAEASARESLAIRRKLLGDEHPVVANSLMTLGVTLVDQHKYAEAETVQREVLAIRRRHRPADHPDIATAIGNLSWTLSRTRRGDDLAEVEALMHESNAILRKVYGDEHPEVADGLSLLTEVQRGARKLEKAEDTIRKAIAIGGRTYGPEHRKALYLQQQLAAVLADQGRMGEAETLLREVLQTTRKSLGDEHLFVASALRDLGEVLVRQAKMDEAEASYREALGIRRRNMKATDPLLAQCLAELGNVLRAKGEAAEAEALLREAVSIERAAFTEGDPWRVRSMDALRAVLAAQGKTVEAEAIQAELDRAGASVTRR